MANTFKMWLATLGVAALTTACGTASPTASTPDIPGGEATGAVTSLFSGSNVPQPETCNAQLMLSKVASSKTSVSVRATWVSKLEKSPLACGSPTWSVSPEAKTFSPRFEPNTLTILGPLGKGYFVTASAAGQTISIKVAIGD
jgi:hypothetical protein